MPSMTCPSPRWTAPVTTIRPIVVDRLVSNPPPVVPVRPIASTRRARSQMSNLNVIPEVNNRVNPKAMINRVGVDIGNKSKEYPMSKNKYIKASYSGNLETRIFCGKVSESATMPFRYDHLSVFDILKYVTCGGVLSDSYKDSFLDYIMSELKLKCVDVKEYTESVSRIDGCVYNRRLPLIAWCDYGLTAKLCLEWVLCNPEKLGRC